MDETYGTYVDDDDDDDACFDIHDYDDDTDHDTGDNTDDDTDDDTNDDTDDDTDDGGRGNLYTIIVPGCCSAVPGPCGLWSLVLGPYSSVLGLGPSWEGTPPTPGGGDQGEKCVRLFPGAVFGSRANHH